MTAEFETHNTWGQLVNKRAGYLYAAIVSGAGTFTLLRTGLENMPFHRGQEALSAQTPMELIVGGAALLLSMPSILATLGLLLEVEAETQLSEPALPLSLFENQEPGSL